MQLVSFSCEAHKEFAPTINGIDLQTVNLFVGRNGSGKSYALRRIEGFADIISEKEMHAVVKNWRATFVDSEQNAIEYSFGWNAVGFSINHEKLTINGKTLIDRQQASCYVFSESSQSFETISPPDRKLVIHVRRDIKAYPEFEQLIQWAESTYSFRFGTIVPTISDIDQKLSKVNFSSFPPDKLEISPADIFDGLSDSQRWAVRNLMEDFGYTIKSINVRGSGDNKNVTYSEKDVSYEYDISTTSQGTFRTFILLSYFLRLVHTKNPQLILIDDLGEGLDYQRAVKLGKFIFDSCKAEGVQLIATSNDGFLMDAIPIENWNVLRRNGTEITALNEKNHPELFDNFAFTGLSNFDFFSSDYIDSHLR